MSTKNTIRQLLSRHTAVKSFLRYIFTQIMMTGMWVRNPERAKHNRNILNFDRHVPPLLSPDVLADKIAYVKAMAKSAEIKDFFIISRPDTASLGLFSYVLTHFSCIVYALALGKIPVIDMQNYPSIYLEKDKIGKENAWEYYFKQPFGHGLNSLQRGSKVKREKGIMYGSCLPLFLAGNEPDFDLHFNTWRIIYRNFFCLNDDVYKYIDEEYNNYLKPGVRVLGVLYRGADYNPITAPGHPIQPNIDVVIGKVKSVVIEWNCDYIFLVTPEVKYYDIFDSHFPGKVLRNKTSYYNDIDFTKQRIGTIEHNRPNDKYLKGLEYLSDIIILSRCTSAVLCQTSGSMAARYINDGKYENVYVFDLGNYIT